MKPEYKKQLSTLYLNTFTKLVLNESSNHLVIDSLLTEVSVADKLTYSKELVSRANKSVDKVLKRKYLSTLLIIIASIHNISMSQINTDLDDVLKSLLNKPQITLQDVESYSEVLKGSDSDWSTSNYRPAQHFTTSIAGQDFIKDHEKLRLKAYDIQDGMITIGYGHAEPVNKSKYQLGDSITVDEADRLFKTDLKIAENGVKRIFKRWSSQNINIPINQQMFDALVSMAFNMGVKGLWNSDFIKQLKRTRSTTEAAKLIQTTNTAAAPGLPNRRHTEKNLFLSS